MASFTIYGSGLVGCTIGGWLQHGGADVQFITRSSRRTSFEKEGMSVRSLDNNSADLEPSSLQCIDDLSACTTTKALLLCVKSMDTHRAAQDIAQHLPNNIPIISLQNGLDNVTTLKAALPDHTIVAGMVGFNCVEAPTNKFAITTEGGIYLEGVSAAHDLRDGLSQTPIDCELHGDMQAVQWGKIALNLNNGINAMSGLPLAEQLQDRNWRRLLALCIDEALAVARAQDITPAKIGKVDPRTVSRILRLPTWLFTRLARKMVKIDPKARSSMADDLTRGRPPEIDHLNGAIATRGAQFGVPTPANTFVTEKVKRLFAASDKQFPNAVDVLEQFR